MKGIIVTINRSGTFKLRHEGQMSFITAEWNKK